MYTIFAMLSSVTPRMRKLIYLGAVPILALAAGLGVTAWNHYRTPDTPLSDPEPLSKGSPDNPVRIQFRELAKAAGITFTHQHSETDLHYVPEIMGSGVAWLDYDQDGYMDLLFIQGGQFPPDPAHQPRTPPTCRLYRNMGDGTFADVTEKAGLWHPDFGQGVAVGDYDNDGYPDVFIACYNSCHLFHNEPVDPNHPAGERHFREVTEEAGIVPDRWFHDAARDGIMLLGGAVQGAETTGWCTSCAFGDIHQTGYLDLFVCRYTLMDLAHYPWCGDRARIPPLRYSCGPKEFRGNSSLLFRNNGNGTFTEVSREAGLERENKGLGVMILDLDGDGKVDIFVGNDELSNHHYKNLGKGKLKSCAVSSGTGANSVGKPLGSMGLEADDLTGKGRPDIFISTYYHEGTLLFQNQGNNFFTDISQSAGMYKASWDMVGWGCCLLDADRDGNLDLFVANGHVYRNAVEIMEHNEDGTPHTYRMPAQIFRGNRTGLQRREPVFQDVSRDAGPYFQEGHIGRGVALCDYDNDGLMDIAVNNCGEPAVLLHNETSTPYHWVRLQLEGTRHLRSSGSNRDAVGACVTLKVGGQTLVRNVKGGTSYLSSPDRRLLIGLGPADKVDDVEVRWPNAEATVEHFGPLEVDRNYLLVEGEAKPREARCPPLKK
jgi:hypothetical protein